ncbi:MAG: gamma-glutamylcyclotransferase [bacterium]
MQWIFGYGSLIWRPDFEFVARRPARVHGWQRRFWQGSHDHRGVPERPGRVVTLVAADGGHCDGMAYQVTAADSARIFDALDHREKNGYERRDLELHFLDADGDTAPGIVYLAPEGNHAVSGPAGVADIARQIVRSTGPSGRNIDYLIDLAAALWAMNADDEHVFELEHAIREHL